MRDYEALFANSGDLMCELDGGSRLLRVNQAMKRFLGVDMDGGQESLIAYLDGRDRGGLETALAGLGELKTTAVFEGRLRKPTGVAQSPGMHSYSWTSWQLTRVANNRLVAVGRDISDHRDTAQQLESKTSFLQSIIEAEPECVKLVSRSGELLDMNAAGLRMIGASNRDEAIGQNVYDLMAPEDLDRFVAFNERVCDGQGGELSFDIIGLDGTRRSMETTAVSLPGEEGQESVHLAITRDVTHSRELEQQLRQAQKMEAVGQLAGGIAHDFNNLLTAIIGPAELALDHVGDNHELFDDLTQIKATGERAARLTQQLLAFARRQVVQLTNLSVADLIMSMHEMLERILGEAFSLDLDVEPLGTMVRADRTQLEQVVLNLVVNARDALGDRGTIRISVSDEELTDARARRMGCSPGRHVALSVSDSGVGIPSDKLGHVFDPFFTTKQVGAGTGLGLATSYGIARQLGGTIEVQSLPGEGATFTVLLPFVESEPAVLTAAQAPSRGQTEPILLVEDEPSVRSAVTRLLSSLGYVVHQAANAESALQLAETLDEIALLVTDMTMPGMGGLALAEELHRKRPELKVLYMTGYLPSTARPEGGFVAEGMILQKPFATKALAEAVSLALHGAVAS